MAQLLQQAGRAVRLLLPPPPPRGLGPGRGTGMAGQGLGTGCGCVTGVGPGRAGPSRARGSTAAARPQHRAAAAPVRAAAALTSLQPHRLSQRRHLVLPGPPEVTRAAGRARGEAVRRPYRDRGGSRGTGPVPREWRASRCCSARVSTAGLTVQAGSESLRRPAAA